MQEIHTLRAVRFPIAEDVYQAAADEILALIVDKDFRCNIVTGCGSTINPINRRIVDGLLKLNRDVSGVLFIFQDEWGVCCEDSLSYDDPRRFRTITAEIFAALAPLGFDSTKNTLWPDDVYAGRTFNEGDLLAEWEDEIRARGGIDGVVLVPGPLLHICFCEAGFAPAECWLSKPPFMTRLTEEAREQDKHYPGCNGDIERVPKFAMTLVPGTFVRLLNPAATVVFCLRFAYNRQNVVDMFRHGTGPERPATVYRELALRGHAVSFFYDAEAGSSL